MIRKALLLAVFAAGVSIAVPASSERSPDALRIDPVRLERRLQELGRIGRNAGGGIDRPAFGSADVKARETVMGWMREIGLEVRVDAAGNIIGDAPVRLAAAGPPVILGSHIDSVLNGGMFDGALGVVAALECFQVLREIGFARRFPLEIIVFADEEGGSIGSKAMIGELPAAALDSPGPSGASVREGIRAIGGDPDRLPGASRLGERIRAYVELHIEQGGKLEAERTDIGIVEGIVGIRRYEAVIEGAANHAGTTPMEGRKDALIAASELVLAVNRVVTSRSGAHVGTVGRLLVEPNVPNVIPGRVVLTVELRDLSEDVISSLYERIIREAATIERSTGIKISFTPLLPPSRPAPTDPEVCAFIAGAAAALGLSAMVMPSGAGHDAQNMARLGPMGMIFIPSRGGISHSPGEYSSPRDVVNGANCLLQTVIRLER